MSVATGRGASLESLLAAQSARHLVAVPARRLSRTLSRAARASLERRESRRGSRARPSRTNRTPLRRRSAPCAASRPAPTRADESRTRARPRRRLALTSESPALTRLSALLEHASLSLSLSTRDGVPARRPTRGSSDPAPKRTGRSICISFLTRISPSRVFPVYPILATIDRGLDSHETSARAFELVCQNPTEVRLLSFETRRSWTAAAVPESA